MNFFQFSKNVSLQFISVSHLILAQRPMAPFLFCFVVTIHKAAERKQNFGQVHNSFIRIYNTDTNEEIMKYELEEDFSIETAVEFGRLYRRNGQWKFEAIGVGMKGGLEDYVNKYQ